ncbi:MAG: hypothetical protein ACF787_02000, partial [Rhodopirellula sp. JB053]
RDCLYQVVADSEGNRFALGLALAIGHSFGSGYVVGRASRSRPIRECDRGRMSQLTFFRIPTWLDLQITSRNIASSTLLAVPVNRRDP